MIEFKNPLLRVRCLECKEEHHIDMKHIGTEKELRNIGFEYEYIFRGELKCSNCDGNMRLITTIYEFPKGELNYHQTDSEGCSLQDVITDDLLNVLKEPTKKEYDSYMKNIDLYIKKAEIAIAELPTFNAVSKLSYEDWVLFQKGELKIGK